MLHTFFFSPANTTRKYASIMTDAYGDKSQIIDITHGKCNIEQPLCPGDTVLILAPVYAGRLPQLAVDQFRKINGQGLRAIVAAIYGNRDYDDALLELADIATTCGCEVVAAGAFVAQHCIFPKVANGRPDSSDIRAAVSFINSAKTAGPIDLTTLKGNRPYKKSNSVPLHPETIIKQCRSCGVCVTECPTGAIDGLTLKTDTGKCISCCRCIAVCTNHARQFKGIMYKAAGKIFCTQNSARKEPEIFLGK